MHFVLPFVAAFENAKQLSFKSSSLFFGQKQVQSYLQEQSKTDTKQLNLRIMQKSISLENLINLSQALTNGRLMSLVCIQVVLRSAA